MRKILTFTLFAFFLLGSASLSAASANPKVLLQTNLGEFVIELFPHEAPVTVKNFLDNVDGNFYNDTIFHSVVPGFFIQGGGLAPDFSTKPSRTLIKNEASNGLKNDAFMVSMVRSAANESAASQFFINMQNNSALNMNGKNPGYAVFGKVVEGMETVEKISLQPRGMYERFPEAPNLAVRILKIVRIDPNAPPPELKVSANVAASENSQSNTAPFQSSTEPMSAPQ